MRICVLLVVIFLASPIAVTATGNHQVADLQFGPYLLDTNSVEQISSSKFRGEWVWGSKKNPTYTQFKGVIDCDTSSIQLRTRTYTAVNPINGKLFSVVTDYNEGFKSSSENERQPLTLQEKATGYIYPSSQSRENQIITRVCENQQVPIEAKLELLDTTRKEMNCGAQPHRMKSPFCEVNIRNAKIYTHFITRLSLISDKCKYDSLQHYNLISYIEKTAGTCNPNKDSCFINMLRLDNITAQFATDLALVDAGGVCVASPEFAKSLTTH